MKGHGTKFSRKMEATVAALLTQANVEAAARSVDISVATRMRWQKEPEFQRALQQARRAAFGQAIARLPQMSGAAVATLGEMMVNKTPPPSTRVRAAEIIINQAAKAIELEDIEARVTELERAAGTQKRGAGGQNKEVRQAGGSALALPPNRFPCLTGISQSGRH